MDGHLFGRSPQRSCRLFRWTLPPWHAASLRAAPAQRAFHGIPVQQLNLFLKLKVLLIGTTGLSSVHTAALQVSDASLHETVQASVTDLHGHIRIIVWQVHTFSTPSETVTIAASAWKLRPSAHVTVTPEAPYCTFSTTAPYLTSSPTAMCSASFCQKMHNYLDDILQLSASEVSTCTTHYEAQQGRWRGNCSLANCLKMLKMSLLRCGSDVRDAEGAAGGMNVIFP